tara:strand:+ start:2468 stop:2584 length:117 start_codon:yes stop_codon:yes gene_type:complete
MFLFSLLSDDFDKKINIDPITGKNIKDESIGKFILIHH